MSFTCFLQDSIDEKKTEDVKEFASVTAKASDGSEDIVFNPNVFTEFKLAGSPEVFFLLIFPFLCLNTTLLPIYGNMCLSHCFSIVIARDETIMLLAQYSYITPFYHIHQEIAADEDNVRKVGQYLIDVALPKFIQDLCTLEVSPMDGQTLTEALHAHGINVRCIGKVRPMYFGQY